jgi:hypothetical protein
MQVGELIEHPEGGRFREVHRSAFQVKTADGAERAALTHIYFSLSPGETSSFHRVKSDEVWNLYAGKGVRLLLWDGVSEDVEEVELSAVSGHFCHVIPALTWQAAEPLEDTVLVGCSVAPGFEFDDFELLTGTSADGQRLVAARPEMRKLIHS